MFSSASATLNNEPRNPQDRNYRAPLPHTNTQSNMIGFNPGSTSSGGYGSWSGSTGGGINDPFTPSRSHYQPGFLMSVTQSNITPPGGQHIEDPPLIPTKFNPSASRTSPSEFGLESMFERSTARRQRQSTNDEDAPPTVSVNDIMDESYSFQRRDSGSPLGHSATRRQPHTPQQQPQVSANQPVTYLNVFGYPLDRYESIIRLFQSLGDTTEPEPSENGMWFTIGFRQPWEAERALRRNGKVMDDFYMLGVARASPSASDMQSDIPRSGAAASAPGSPPSVDPSTPGKDSLVPAFGMSRPTTANSLGMPLTLAPSTAAFKTPSAQRKVPSQQQPQPGMSESSTIAKISDMIFGW